MERRGLSEIAPVRSRFRSLLSAFTGAVLTAAAVASGTGILAPKSVIASSSYSAAVLADKPMVYYRLNETSGSSAADSSGNINGGFYSPTGVTYSVPGALLNESDTALSLSGSATVVDSAFPPSPTGNTTTELWFKVGSSQYSSGIDDLISDNSVIAFLTNGGASINVGPGFGGDLNFPLPHPANDGQWHLFDIGWSGPGSNVCAVYYDGRFIGAQGNGYRTCGSQTTGLVVGAFNNNGTAGSFDEVAVYPTQLSGTRIAAHWSIGASHLNQVTQCAPTSTSAFAQAVLADNPSVYLRLDELSSDAAGRVAFDASRNCAANNPTNGTYTPTGISSTSGALLGDPDTAMAFAPGTTASIADTSAALPPSSQPSTVQFWFKVAASDYGAGRDQLLSDGNQELTLENGGTSLLVTPGLSGHYVSFLLPHPVNDGKWHLFDVEYFGNSSGGCSVSLDGIGVGSGGNTYAFCGGTSGTPGLVIGNWSQCSSGICQGSGTTAGSFDEVAVFSTALNASQIAAAYTAGTMPPSPTINSVTVAGHPSGDPAWAPFTGGDTVFITGNNFGTNPVVRFHGPCLTLGCVVRFDNRATVTSSDSNKITAIVPSVSLYDVAALVGPAVLEVDALSGADTKPFTYVVPEIGRLFVHRPNSTSYDHCNAAVVQSANHRVLLTAGHCLTDVDPTTGKMVRFNDLAFAPGYFGPSCPATPAIHGTSDFFGCGGTTPYGIWCALNDPLDKSVSDSKCGNTAGSSAVYLNAFYNAKEKAPPPPKGDGVWHACPPPPGLTPNWNNGCHILDFGYIVTAPHKDGTTVGQTIGGGLSITFNWGGGGSNSQVWSLLAYTKTPSYLADCNASSSQIASFGLGSLTIAAVVEVSDPSCSFVVPGTSGGPWINSQNGALYGIGAVNDAAQDGGTVTGAYMGIAAQLVWRLIESCTTNCLNGGLG